MKQIVKNEHIELYVDPKEIAAVKAIKTDSYFLIYIYLKNSSEKIELKASDIEEFNNIIEKLKN